MPNEIKKNLFFINGNSCVGKSATSHALMQVLSDCAFLDVDWCFFMHPSIYSDDVRNLRYKNCCFIINNYLHAPMVKNIIFCNTISDQKWIDWIMSQLDLSHANLFKIILTANEKAYQQRIQTNIERGKRPEYFIALKDGKQVCEKYVTYKLAQMYKYERLDGIKIDTSNLTVDQVVQKIVQISEQTQLG